MQEEEELFFVNVDGADELRKELLESSKNVIEILRNYERFKSANTEKQKEIENLRLKTREIVKLISKLKCSLPRFKLPPIKEKGKMKREVKVAKKSESELDRLEKELNEIGSKLDSLS